jgi:hypothetical protein
MRNIDARDAAFALIYDPQAAPVEGKVFAVTWTKEVLEVLRQIRNEAEEHAREEDEDARMHLPFADLRARIVMLESRWGSMQDHVGLRYFYEGAEDPNPWGYLCDADAPTAKKALNRAFSEWVEGALQAYIDQRKAFRPGIRRLFEMQQADKVFKLTPIRMQLFPWPATGPAQGAGSPFNVTAGFLASRLAGKEIFPELGPVVRIMGGPEANHAELMTLPQHAEGGRFSLVCEISIETLPGGTWPLIFVQFKRRRWADTMSAYPKGRSIGGFVIPHEARPGAAFRFTLSRRDGAWNTDLGYRYFEQNLGLAQGYDHERVLQYPSDNRASVLVMVKADVTEATKSDLNAGVPLVDQGDAFERVADALMDIGLRRFDGFMAITPPKFKPAKLEILKAEVTLSHLLLQYEQDAEDEDVRDGSVQDRSIGQRLEAATGTSSERFYKETPKLEVDPKMTSAIRTLVAETAYGIDYRRRVVYLVTDTPEDIAWVKASANAIFGEALDVISMALPADAHGPAELLPEASGKNRARFDARLRIWEAFITEQKIPRGAMILVQAALLYAPTGGGKRKRDHWVNKHAAKKAFAMAGCTVQYLLPSEIGRIDKFQPRVQAALLDLVFGHGGLVWGLQQSSEAMFPDSTTRPRWVAGIGSVQLTTEWKKNATVLVSTRMECATGKAWVRFGHQEAQMAVSDWMPFDEGASYVAGRRLALPHKADAKRTAFAHFASETLEDIHQLDPNAVVLIDSTRTAKLGAGWLSDRSISGGAIEVSRGVLAHERWPGLRLLRIRSQAPSMGQEKIYKHLETKGQKVRTWTTTPKLFQVQNTPVPTYWSLAKQTGHPKRGVSCYRTVMLPNPKPTEENPGPVAAFPPRAKDQHANPRAIEVAVLRHHDADNPERLAAFAQALRAGMLTAQSERWVSSPSPLQIIDALAQYMRA